MLRALVLVGGLGTRLRAAVPDRPKALAPVGDQTFLDVQLDSMVGWGVADAVLLAGYKSEQVMQFAQARHAGGRQPTLTVVVERSPLGTAGALRNAEAHCGSTFLMLNGDTYFDLDAARLLEAHRRSGATVTLAACRVPDTSRYGALELDADSRIRGFREKDASVGPGWINAGIYVMEPAVLNHIPTGRAVSMEKEVFPELAMRGALAASVQEGSFFDIGTPASYAEFSGFLKSKRGPSSQPAGGTP